MSSCCPICYKVCITNRSGGEETEDELEVQRNFFKMFERYVHGKRQMDRMGQSMFPPEEFAKIGLISCGECIQLMKSFCELYHQLKRTELLLNGKVWTLGNIMTAAQEASSRTRYFREIMQNVEVEEHPWGSGDALLESIFKSKKSLIAECSQKVVNGFPKLSLLQWLPNGRESSIKSNLARLPTEDDVLSPNANILGEIDSSPVSVSVNSISLPPKRWNLNYRQLKDEPNEVVEGYLEMEPEALSSKVGTDLVDEQQGYEDQPESLNTISDISFPELAQPDTAGLRSIYKCIHCKKTFSSMERLQFHTDGVHIGSGTLGAAASLSDSGDSWDDNESESDHLTWTSSSGEEGEEDDPIIDLRSVDLETNEKRDFYMQSEDCLDSPSSSNSDEDRDIKYPEQEIKVQTRSTPLFSSGSESGSCSDESENNDGGKGPTCRLKCPECPYLFTDLKSLLLHRRTSECCRVVYDPNKSIKVEVRVRVIGERSKNANPFSPKYTKVFAVIDLPQAIFICDTCDLAFYSTGDLETHKKLHGTFHCQFCKVEKSYAVHLSIHEFKHASLNKPSHGCCPRCSFEWKLETEGDNMEYVRHHLQQHLGLTLNEPICAICKTHREDLSESGLGNHLKSHHDITVPDKIRKCRIDDCNAYFLTSEQLGCHWRYRHNSGKMYNCEVCNELFHSSRQLRNHRLKKHKHAQSLPCPVPNCSRTSGSEEELLWHIKRAGGFHGWLERHNNTSANIQIQCPKCDKSCLGEAELRQHVIKAHDGSHVCEFCGKEFARKEKLRAHHLVHSGPESWKFECKICSRKCRDKGKLNEHLRTHSNDKPYVCEMCGQSYAHRHNLRIHVNNKHGDDGKNPDAPQKYNKVISLRGKVLREGNI